MTFEVYLRAARNVYTAKGMFGFIKLILSESFRFIIRQFIFSSFAQDWEDLQVEKLINSKKPLFYIDIGGNDPVRLNNTYRFYKQGGSGILVEPNPLFRPLFVKKRPRDKFIPAGIGTNNDELNFYNFEIPSISTFSQKEAEKNLKSGFKLKEKIKVKVITPEEICEIIPKKTGINFLSIDIEGWDYRILKRWDFDRFAPEVICVEIGKDEDSINKLLTGNDYQLKFTNGVNNIYKRV